MRNKAVVSLSPSVLAFRFLPCCVLVKDRIGFLPCSSAPLEKWLEQEICFFISFSPTLVSWSSSLNCWFCLHLTSFRIASAVISLRDYTGIQKVLLCMCAMSIQMGTQTCTVVFLWSDNSLQVLSLPLSGFQKSHFVRISRRWCHLPLSCLAEPSVVFRFPSSSKTVRGSPADDGNADTQTREWCGAQGQNKVEY